MSRVSWCVSRGVWVLRAQEALGAASALRDAHSNNLIAMPSVAEVDQMVLQELRHR